jgi:hypothetical protein
VSDAHENRKEFIASDVTLLFGEQNVAMQRMRYIALFIMVRQGTH